MPASAADAEFIAKLGVVGMLDCPSDSSDYNEYQLPGSVEGTHYLSIVIKMDDGLPPVEGADFTFIVHGAGGTTPLPPVDLGDGFWLMACSMYRGARMPGETVTGILRLGANTGRGFRASKLWLRDNLDSIYIRTTGTPAPRTIA